MIASSGGSWAADISLDPNVSIQHCLGIGHIRRSIRRPAQLLAIERMLEQDTPNAIKTRVVPGTIDLSKVDCIERLARLAGTGRAVKDQRM